MPKDCSLPHRQFLALGIFWRLITKYRFHFNDENNQIPKPEIELKTFSDI